MIVADDHPLYRVGLVDAVKRRPELELVGEAEDGRAALELIHKLEPDVAVLDVRIPQLDGVTIVEALTAEQARTRVVLVSGAFDQDTVFHAVSAGARGFLSKLADSEEICEAVSAVARGETVLSRDIQALLASEVRRRAPADTPVLTEREHEVLALTAEGLSAAAIGERLHLGATTVKTHLSHGYEKLGVSDRAAAVHEAMRRGLLDR